jgi:hypothetical protein
MNAKKLIRSVENTNALGLVGWSGTGVGVGKCSLEWSLDVLPRLTAGVTDPAAAGTELVDFGEGLGIGEAPSLGRFGLFCAGGISTTIFSFSVE